VQERGSDSKAVAQSRHVHGREIDSDERTGGRRDDRGHTGRPRLAGGFSLGLPASARPQLRCRRRSARPSAASGGVRRDGPSD
jgi:hypothetical protein